ncbi:MAG: peptidoglycan DD-metalloendopeptidase family protein [Clostridia bacterium]|nr:peptidoglycan DD-metalloendopeptidase family protein [Clostridia bacterium]
MRNIISNQEDPNMENGGENSSVAQEVKVKKTPRKITVLAEHAVNYIKANSVAAKSTAIGFFVFAVILTIIANVQVGYAVVFNNKTIGYVSEKDATLGKIDGIIKELSDSIEGEKDIDISADLVPSFAPDSRFVKEDDIEQIIKSELSFYEDAAAVYIDGKFAFAAKDADSAKDFIKKYQDKVCGDGTILSVESENEVTYRQEKVVYTEVLDLDAAMSRLSGTDSKEGLYVVKEGDTLWSIGIDNDMPTDYLMTLNNLDSEVIQIGSVLRVKYPEPIMDIKVVKDITYTEYHPYETEKRYDKSLNVGTYRTYQKGSNGETRIRATVTYVNNSEVEREITEKTVISEPVNEILLVGTKPKPKTAATGRFAKPISGGYVSSSFGNRSRGYHTGVDWAVSYGTPIYASDGGTVTASGWSGGYGRMIKINHGNGYETLYAHCSKLVVSTGKKVAKGQLIAYVGSTGNSTGPHLHFEIRKNGAYLNPTKYCGE